MILFGFVAAIVFGGGRAKADFVFGEPTKLGPPVNSSYADLPGCIPSDTLEFVISTDRPGNYGYLDLWVLKRETLSEPWGAIVHLDSRINTSGQDSLPSLSSNGLELYFNSNNSSGGYGGFDIWMAERSSLTSEWGSAVNLGGLVNSSAWDASPVISSDNLTLYFSSRRAGGYGSDDIWVSSRETKYEPWEPPINLGAVVNSTASELPCFISNDERLLIFNADRPGPFRSGGYGASDIWMTSRKTRFDEWEEPVNLGPNINTTAYEHRGIFCTDSAVFYFTRGNAVSDYDIYQAPIFPIIDFNSDGIVDADDMCIMIDHWGEDYSLCDIGPMPWGDGIVDVKDLIILAEHMYGYIQPAAHWTMNETAGDTAHDKFGKNDALVYGGALWQPAGGKVGGALMFDGADDYVDTPFILNPGKTSLSVTAWIRGGATGQVIISQADVEGQSALESGGTWLGISPSEGRLMTGLMDIFFGPLESESVVADGQWHHVGLVYDYAAMKRHLYVDGAQVAVDAGIVAGVQSTAGLYIGAGQTLDAGSFFSGLIDDVRIYNKALTPDQIQSLSR